jgi:hypothetical protein
MIKAQAMKPSQFLYPGILITAAAVFLLAVSFINLNFAKEDFLAAFNYSSSRLSNFSIQSISALCGANYLPQVSLSWGSPGRVTSYSIQRRISGGVTWVSVGTTAQTTFVDKNWTAGYTNGLYEYRVIATNSSRSSTSNTASVRVPACLSPTPTPTPTPSASATTSTSILWGAYAGDATTDAANFESQVGHKMNLQAIFVDLNNGSTFPSEFAPTVSNQGKTLIIFWEPYNVSLDSIIAGNLDNYIKQFAVDAKTYGGQVILAPLHEMNGDWDPWGGTIGTNTPAKVIATWQRIHDLFSGVSNVKFGWVVNNESVPDTAANQLENYYPGASYVDYVGVDGFNFGSPWQSFSELFDNALSRLKIYNKPVYIFSFASADGSNKPAWIADALTIQLPKHPEVKGWVWFNQNKEQNWLVWSSDSSLAAFKAALP